MTKAKTRKSHLFPSFAFKNNRNSKTSATVCNRVNSPHTQLEDILVFLCTFYKIVQRFAQRAQLLFNEVYNEREEQEDTIRKQTVV